MSVTHFSTRDASSGLAPEVLRKFTWATIAGLNGINRVRVLNDLDTHDIRPEVRVNAEALKRFKGAKATGILVNFGQPLGEVEVTTQWMSLRPGPASYLDRLRYDDPKLGAQGQEMRSIDDGYGGKTMHAFTSNGHPDLFEFRMPGEATGETFKIEVD